jgi:hypothetical protein
MHSEAFPHRWSKRMRKQRRPHGGQFASLIPNEVCSHCGHCGWMCCEMPHMHHATIITRESGT